MKLVLTLSLLALGACVEAASPTSVNELLMAQAEAKAYRAAWIELQRRDEILGLSTLSNDVQDSHDQVVRLSGELIRAERYAKQMQDQMGKVVDAAAIWAGEPIPAKKATARADAQVVAVDRQQQSIVLNLGTRQGAKEGMPFRILRGDKVVGSCRLLEVRELISAGLPEQLGEGIQIQVGDRIAVLAQK